MTLLFLLIIGYLVGSVPTGVILASYFTEVNIREQGSHNIGATNMYRVTGARLGVLTLVGDAIKGMGMVAFAGALLTNPLLVDLVAFSTFLGHCYSIYLDFKGGKGVATAAGIYLWLTPLACLLAMTLWVVLVLRTKRSSVGALVAALSLPAFVLAFESYRTHITLTLAIVAVLVWRHRENIDRLLKGEEPRTSTVTGQGPQ